MGQAGPQGPAGIDGIDGKDGRDGKDGKDGVDGKPGLKGDKGDDSKVAGPPGEVTYDYLKRNSLWCTDGKLCTIPEGKTLQTNNVGINNDALAITRKGVVQFGSDITGKQDDAGKIKYDDKELHVYGSGGTIGGRNISLYDNVTIPGTLNVNGKFKVDDMLEFGAVRPKSNAVFGSVVDTTVIDGGALRSDGAFLRLLKNTKSVDTEYGPVFRASGLHSEGDTTVGGKLNVTGAATLASDLTVSGANIRGANNLNFASDLTDKEGNAGKIRYENQVLHIHGGAKGGTWIAPGNRKIKLWDDVEVGNGLTVKGGLNVNGGASFDNTLNVTGTTTLKNATMTGATTMADFTASGTATLKDLTTSGTASLNNGLTVGGETNIKGANNLNFGYDVPNKELNAGKIRYENGILNIHGGGTGSWVSPGDRKIKLMDNVEVGNGLTVGGATSMKDLTASGTASLNGKLIVGGGKSIINADGSAFFGGSLIINSKSVINADGSLNINSKSAINADGSLNINGSRSMIYADGSAFFGGSLNINSKSAINADGSLNINGKSAINADGSASFKNWLNVDNGLTVGGTTSIKGSNVLQFGSGVDKRENDAGKIGYNMLYNKDSLDIVGSGTGTWSETNRRKIFLWDDVTTRNDLTVGGETKIKGSNNLNFASDLTDKEVNAGKIRYENGILNIHGGGTGTWSAPGNRKIKLMDDVEVGNGLTVGGETNIKALTASGAASLNGNLTVKGDTDMRGSTYLKDTYVTGDLVITKGNVTWNIVDQLKALDQQTKALAADLSKCVRTDTNYRIWNGRGVNKKNRSVLQHNVVNGTDTILATEPQADGHWESFRFQKSLKQDWAEDYGPY